MAVYPPPTLRQVKPVTRSPSVARNVPGASPAAGAVPSPNIWRWPGTYEVENRAFDPDGRIDAAMWTLRPWDAAVVLDIGCGTGFHLPGFAERAARVVGVEPHPRLARAATRRVAAVPNAEVLLGAAQALPVPDRSVDVAHARWAYFLGPGCEPGLRELRRVLRRAGMAFLIDFDATTSTFGRWFRLTHPSYDPDRVERFWGRHGFTRQPVRVRFRFQDRADLSAVLHIEFPAEAARRFSAEHRGLEIDCALNVWWRAY